MRWLLVCLVFILTSACSGRVETMLTPTNSAPTVTATVQPTSTPFPLQTQGMLSTPTQVSYTVRQGDTLKVITDLFGISLQALEAANPGVQATALQVGKVLIIPTSDQFQTSAATPASVRLVGCRCYPEVTGGLWCLAWLVNENYSPLENIIAQFSLFDTSGKSIGTQIAYPLLDVLPPGRTLPLAVHFTPPMPANAIAQVQLLTSILILPGDARYLPVMLENTLVQVDSSGLTAWVSGRAYLTSKGETSSLMVLAVAYDAAGNVIGFRRWKASSPVTREEPIAFEFLVSSLGPPIERVDFLTQAQP
jgi:LysM repeat protein